MAKKQDLPAGRQGAEELDIDAEMGGSRVYELGFHIDPELSNEEVKKVYQATKELIEKQGSLVAEGDPQKVQLAYTISRQDQGGRRDFNSAHFAWIAYETSAENHAKVLEAVGEEARIIRSLDVITSKDAARHAAEMRLMETAVEAEASAKAEEAVSDAELDAALENVGA